MTRADRNKRTDRSSAGKYRETARSFLASAEALATLANDDEAYGNAIALLAVHAAIGYADAIAIAYGERKSTAGDHEQVVALLTTILRTRLPAGERTRLLKLVKLKDTVAYQGKYFQLDEARQHLILAARFAAWAEQMYQRRPV